MNKLKGKFRTWKSGKQWLFAGTVLLVAADISLGGSTCLADVTQNQRTEEISGRSLFSQGSQDGYEDAKNGGARKTTLDDDYGLGYNYGYDFGSGQSEKARQEAHRGTLGEKDIKEKTSPEAEEKSFSQGSQDGYYDGQNGNSRNPKYSEKDYLLGYNYGYDFGSGQEEKARQEEHQDALDEKEEAEKALVDADFEKASKTGFEHGLAGSEMQLDSKTPQELQEAYLYGYLAGQEEKARQEAH
ncbi:KxYKxGKxW signal peptide [Streptococcus pyogenes]|uniref:KxYKxGKxW signal peptide domain-containing protein n=1 Tax=Streptococcus pyogenes TaxID=1314 RepID=UPI00109B831B|nr:KxYKxGKxW signal peptide domain-containing protein [Streptococcus pyogenes]VGQ36846.1 KxYKxGKxW signal peptide [Streptococcus pyogenes]